MPRRPLIALAVAGSLALSAAAPAPAAAEAPSDDSHCYIFRPTVEHILAYVRCELKSVSVTRSS